MPSEAAVEVVEEANEDTAQMGPLAFAKHLCSKADLTSEQKGPVVLIAKDMQDLYAEELVKRGLQEGARRTADAMLSAPDLVPIKLGTRALRPKVEEPRTV